MKKITTIKEHKFKHGNLMDGIADLMGKEKAYIFYSDPPWGKGNLKFWQTMNTKQNLVKNITIDFDAFIDKTIETAIQYTDRKGYILIEYGKRWADYLIKKAEKQDLIHLGSVQTKYKSSNRFLPMDVHLFGKQRLDVPTAYFRRIKGTSGIETVRNAVNPIAKAGKIILDPACGFGYTARVGIANGMIFRGNEINAKRLQRAIDNIKTMV